MTYYEVLGVGKNATQEQLIKARDLLFDKLKAGVAAQEQRDAVELVRIIEEAFGILSDEQQRSWYDQAPKGLYFSDRLKSKLFNLHNLYYCVDIQKSGFVSSMVNMPQHCVCCMSDKVLAYYETEHERAAFSLIKRTLSLKFPLCPACEEHIRDAKRKFYRITTIPAIIACIVAIIIRFFVNNDMKELVSTGLIPIISIGLFLLISLRTRFEMDSLNHSAHRFPAKIVDFDKQKITYGFYNRMFAERFADINGGKRYWYYKKKAPFFSSFLAGYEKPMVAAFALLGWTALAMLVSVFIVPPQF